MSRITVGSTDTFAEVDVIFACFSRLTTGCVGRRGVVTTGSSETSCSSLLEIPSITGKCVVTAGRSTITSSLDFSERTFAGTDGSSICCTSSIVCCCTSSIFCCSSFCIKFSDTKSSGSGIDNSKLLST